MSDVHRQLAAHLNSLAVPFPKTENGLELEVLRKWFCREHAEIALKMTGAPEPVSTIAGRLGEPVEKLAPVLEAMSKQGLIFRMARPGTRKNEKTVCMAFGTGAYYYIENGLGRDVSIEEALDVLRKGMAAGLVPQPGNGQRVWGICMCCSCGCQLLRALKKMEKPAQLAHTNFYATCEDENCTACGTCVERCPMAAIELEDTAMVNRDRCIGCGVCVAACEVDAMVLHAKQEKEQYVPPRDIVDMQKRIAQERRLLQE